MRIRYGNQWTKAIGETDGEIQAAMQEWSNLLGNLSGDEIKHGMETWDSEFPPNVYQFRTACKSGKSIKMHTIHKALPRPPIDKDAIAGYIEKLRGAI